MLRLAVLLVLGLSLAAGERPRPAASPEGDPVDIRLRYTTECSQAARLKFSARLDSGALGLAFALELTATGRLEALDDAQVELSLSAEGCTLNGAQVPQAEGQTALVRLRLGEDGRPVPGSLQVQWTAGAATDLLTKWVEALIVHLPAAEVRVGEVWDLPVAGPVAAVPLPDGARFSLSGWQRLVRADGLAAELDAGFDGSVDDLPVRLPVTRVRTTIDAALEGDGATVLAADGTLRRLKLDGRARIEVANPADGEAMQARASFSVELVLDPPAEAGS